MEVASDGSGVSMGGGSRWTTVVVEVVEKVFVVEKEEVVADGGWQWLPVPPVVVVAGYGRW